MRFCMIAWFGAAILVFVGTATAEPPPELVAPSGPKTAEEERLSFHLPEGFEIELVASEPEIHKPLNLAFDDLGRLWVTETIEYPFAVPDGKPGRDGLKILSNFAHNGRAQKVETFAKGLNIPIGLLPLPNSHEALVHSIPKVYKVSDTDRDGAADRMDALYEKYGYRDTHGMTNAFSWGFDGWIYACHGFSNDSSVKGSDNKSIAMQSGNTYRMRVDGSHAEIHSRGQVTPFGLAFDPLGNLYSSDCHSRPIYQLIRGAYYPSFGKPDDGLGFGPEMCAHDHGSTGIAGIIYYAANQYPEAFRDNIFVGNVVTNRVNRDTVEWKGASPKAVEQPDLVRSDDRWFRPVDLELGPDGAIYIADFYNKIIGHYEVSLTHPGRDRERGRIWRVVYRGKDGKGALGAHRADLTTATDTALIEDLGHANLTVRIKAANQLAERASERPVEALKTAATADANPDRRAHALWVLQRWGVLDEAMLAKAAGDKDRLVRVHAMRIVAESDPIDAARIELAKKGLDDTDPFVQKTAAEALGRHPASANIAPLLKSRAAVPTEDNHRLHAVRIALRDQFLADDAWKAFLESKPTEQDEAFVADIATGVPGVRSAAYLSAYLTKHPEAQATALRYVHHIARNGNAELDASVLKSVETREGASVLDKAGLFKEFQLGLSERGASLTPEAQAVALQLSGTLLGSENEGEIAAGIALANGAKLKATTARLWDVVQSSKRGDKLRAEALEARSAIDPSGALKDVGKSLEDPALPSSLREKAASLLAASPQPEALAELLKALPVVPGPIQSAIAAGLAVRKPGGEALLKAIGEGKASARLLQENRVAGPLAGLGIPDLNERLATLLKGLPPADQAIQNLIAQRRGGFHPTTDPAALKVGAKLFEANCAACHQIAKQGGKVGPQLDGVGARGVDRLLEDILDPSRNVDQAFRSTILGLKDGQVVSGLLLKEEGEVIVIANAEGKEVRVPKMDVEEKVISPLSPMPANFAERVSAEDFNRLLAYLLSRKVE